MNEYTHSPITEPRRIRVFSIASASSEDEDIRGFLTEISLDTEPIEKYYALSYTWDGQHPDQEILCGGSKFLVTKNCFAALRGMRSSDAEVRVWIDSMCINQNDLVERSHQVALMGEIYSKAAKVLVWLGEWTPAIREAVQLMSYVAGPDVEDPVRLLGYSYADNLDELQKMFAESKDDAELNARINLTFRPNRAGTSSLMLESMDSAPTSPESIRAGVRARAKEVKNTANWNVLNPFLTVSWFTRMWTVQEVVLSTPANVLFFNSKREQITWAQVMAAVDTLSRLRDGQAWLHSGGEHAAHDWLTKTIGNHRSMLERHGSQEPKMTNDFYHLSLVIGQAREKQCREPKDKVFALYGIFRELGIKMPPPDYHKQVGEVYREFTIACMEAEKALNILYHVPSGSRGSIDGLVSWAPDFSSPKSVGRSLAARGSLQGDDVDKGLKAFSASGESTARFGVRNNLSRLQLHLKLVDTVTYCGVHLSWTEAWMRGPSNKVAMMLGIMTTLGSWARASTHCTAYLAPVKKTDAFYDTLIEGFRYNLPASQLNADAFKEVERQKFESWYDSVTALPESPYDFPKLWENMPDGKDAYGWIKKAMSRAAFTPETMMLFAGLRKDLLSRRDFFTTEAGYMGSIEGLLEEGKEVPLLQEGDRIALVQGMHLPMVLRPVDEEPTGKCFQLVTHAYVHGIMHGEAWDDPKFELQEVELV